MDNLHINKTLKKLSLAFVVLFLFFSPLSISLTHSQSDLIISPIIAYAQTTVGNDTNFTDDWGAGSDASGGVSGNHDTNFTDDWGAGSDASGGVSGNHDTNFTDDWGVGSDASGGVSGNNSASSNSAPGASAPAPAAEKQSRSWMDIYEALTDLPKALGRWIGEAILSFCAFLVWMGGSVLDYATTELVLNMGKWINTSSLGIAIDTSWKMIRDICNLAFIFGLVYTGINTIIDPEKASTKRFLSRIIIGALLINFSLFFVKFIIDFANFTTYQIYTSMTSGTGTIAAKIADVLGIITLYSPTSAQTMQNLGNGSIWFYLGAAVFLLVAAFTFLAAGVMLIGRFVALVMIMIFSPILFAATVFPQTESYAKKMWSNLISYAFFAPVYFFLLLVSITMLESFPLRGSSTFVKAMMPTEKAAAAVTSESQFGIVVFFIVAIYFMISALTLAQKIGVAGGSMAISVGKDLRGRGQRFLGGATAGAAAGIGRATAGRYMHNMSQDDNLKDRAATSWIAKQQLKLARTVGDASFDARNVGDVGKKLGVGEGRKGGYKTAMGEVEKKEKEFAQSLGEVDDTDVRVQARKREWEGAQKTQKAETEILRKRLRETSTDDVLGRANLQGEIDALEKVTKDKQVEYEKEKQRRTIGSTYANDERSSEAQIKVKQLANDVNLKKDEIKAYWNGGMTANGQIGAYNSLSDPDKKKRREEIQKLQNELVELEKSNRAFLNKQKDQGYAGVLENNAQFSLAPSSWLPATWGAIKSGSAGHLVVHEREAGKAIRKTAEKGLPKQKE